MDLAKFQLNDEILKLLYQEEQVFIQVIDKTRGTGKANIEIYRPTENWADGFFCKIDGSIYLSCHMKQSCIEMTAQWLCKFSHLHSVYGTTKLLTQIHSLQPLPIKNRYDYYVMELSPASFCSPATADLCNCRLCTEKDFSLLRDLQKQYHLEEVYSSTENYPYAFEMESFRHTLRTRQNAALFVNGVATSKVYITAETNDRYQLGGIFTLKPYRGQGCAWRCLGFFLNTLWQKKRVKKTFQLFVKKNNHAACRLYQKLGFQPKEETSYFYY